MAVGEGSRAPLGPVRAGEGQDPAEGLSDTRTDTEQVNIFNWFKTTAEEPGRRRGINAWAGREDFAFCL